MGMLRQLFGPSKDEIWRQLAHEIKANYVDGGFWNGSKVQAQFKEWTITLDTYVVSTGKSAITYTRLRAPYVNADQFRFTVYRKSIFTGIAKFLEHGVVELRAGACQIPFQARDQVVDHVPEGTLMPHRAP